MRDINDFYSDKTYNILYLELKNINSKYNFPLPILKEDFVEEIKNGTFEEEIEFKYFLRGMIFNIAVDKNFKYSYNYLELLGKEIKNIDEIVLRESIVEIKKNVELSNVFLKFNYDNYKNAESNYYYASTLLSLFSKYQDEYFVKESEKVLNQNLVIDSEYPLTYLLLGDIERHRNNPVKANLYYKSAEKRLNNIKNIKQIEEEVKLRIQDIDDGALYMEIKELLNYSKYYDVINKLEKIKNDSYKKYYYLANAYLGLTEYEKAFENYEKARNYNDKEIEFYIDYSYFLAEIGKVNTALEIIDEGLELYEDNESLLFNRSLIYINVNRIKEAREDLTNIVQYYDISEEIFNNSMILLEKIQDL